MLEEFDGRMIEIGDPTEEPSAPEPPPRVVIEYRERGVPWMLIPPLLVISAVGAVLAYHKFAPPAPRFMTRASESAVVPSPPDDNDEPAHPIKPEPSVVKPTLPPNPPEPAAPPIIPSPPSVVELPPIEPVKEPDPTPFPRVNGLGFDPKTLEPGAKTEAPGDRAIAPAAQGGRPDELGRGIDRAAPSDLVDQPREVDPELLPPDPKLARERRAKWIAQQREEAEADRGRFLAELREVCRRSRDRSGREILKLIKQHDTAVEPAIQQKAAFLLGKTGPYAGIDRVDRIKLLRSLGYPEPAILGDLFDIDKTSIGERDGPRDEFQALYFSARFLLRNPPPGIASTTRPVSSNTSDKAPGAQGSRTQAGPDR